MKRTVVGRRAPWFLRTVILRTNGREREWEIERAQSKPMRIELPLWELGSVC